MHSASADSYWSFRPFKQLTVKQMKDLTIRALSMKNSFPGVPSLYFVSMAKQRKRTSTTISKMDRKQ